MTTGGSIATPTAAGLAACAGAQRGSSDGVGALVVASYGKSGSKRLLRILDFSRFTHCRNEPYGLRGSEFEALSDCLAKCGFDGRAPLDVGARWASAVRTAHARMGVRDRLPSPPKDFDRRLATCLGIRRLLASRTARRVFAGVWPALRHSEWPVPAWVWDPGRLRRALLVLKLSHESRIPRWVLGSAPGARVIHLVRHPGAVLHSWAGRLLAASDAERVTHNNRVRLASVARAEPAWGQVFGDIDRMSAHEAELWFWRYTTEVMHGAGSGREDYVLVRDEDVAADAASVARRVYTFAGLEWDPQVEEHMARWAPHWRSRMGPWRSFVPPAHVRLVERVIEDSPVRSWWAADERVSGFDYTGV